MASSPDHADGYYFLAKAYTDSTYYVFPDVQRLVIEDSPTDGRYRLYGEDVWHGNEVGTDLSAIDRGEISVTPLHYDLTETDAAERMADWALDALHLGHTTPETLDV